MKKLTLIITALFMSFALMIVGSPESYAYNSPDYLFADFTQTVGTKTLSIDAETQIWTIDGTTNSAVYNIPDVFSPNALGHQLYADRDYLVKYEYVSGTTTGSSNFRPVDFWYESGYTTGIRSEEIKVGGNYNTTFYAVYAKEYLNRSQATCPNGTYDNLKFKITIYEIDPERNDFNFLSSDYSNTLNGINITATASTNTVVLNGSTSSQTSFDLISNISSQFESGKKYLLLVKYISGTFTENLMAETNFYMLVPGQYTPKNTTYNVLRGVAGGDYSAFLISPKANAASYSATFSNFTYQIFVQELNVPYGDPEPGESTTPPTGLTLSGSFYQDKVYFNTVTENPFTVYPAVYLATTTGDTFDLNILTENLVFVSADANIRFYIGRISGGEENIGGTGDFVIRKDATNVYIEKLVDSVEQDEVYVPLSDFDFFMIETIPPAAETWTVSFMSEGVILSTQEIDDLSTASIPTAPTRAGYNFVNWVLDPHDPLTVYEFATPVTADLTLYAYWEPNGATVYEVSFITDGGTAVSPIAVEDGDLASAPTPPIRSGYTFLHWVVTGTSDVFSFSTPITGNLSLTAVWEESGEVFYIITFIENGGSTIQDQIVNDGDLPVEPTDPTRTGYLFMGWYSDIALTNAYIFDAALTADMTLYAKWTPVSGGGDPIAEDPASSGSVWLYVGLGAAALAVLAGSQANPKKGKRR